MVSEWESGRGRLEIAHAVWKSYGCMYVCADGWMAGMSNMKARMMGLR